MSLLRLAWRYLWSQPLTAGLNLLLLSLGLAAICFVLLVSEQIEQGVRRDLAGIDLVVGAKGSPMQIMLAGVFHLDVPTGNIPLSSLATLRAHPLVAQALPLSVGDSLQGFRIVGSTVDYLTHYQARFASGQAWSGPMQAVLGAEVAARTGLKPGQTFHGSHGLGAQGAEHAEQGYQVVGVLNSSGGVLDRLVITDLASVWLQHETHHGRAAGEPESDHEPEPEREITMALLKFRSPLAAVSLPRWVNAQPGLQAASPALETARLMRMVGAGSEVLRGFGLVLLLAAACSVFVTLLHSVRARQSDLAMLRMLGAPPWRVALLVSLEALCLAGMATLLGLALGHGLTAALGALLAEQQSLHIIGSWVSPWEALIPVLALGLALLAAAWPARAAFSLDVTELLQAPR
ncbi:ABC transporter permease [Roseateles oligotrophus]|uniref:ABC transporter permease n=1 Tax=Roseateles oligotrophus TaxID=1769250 RepID=A0ABT2YLR8_9BURK|nr:FtsX-like permease family protein [Roseateles oligotrophus]MCV2370993.1 ABC transporter permease [Roseateles oligotrophus]